MSAAGVEAVAGQEPLHAGVGGIGPQVPSGPGVANGPADGDQVAAGQEPRGHGPEPGLGVAAPARAGPAGLGGGGEPADRAGGVDRPWPGTTGPVRTSR